MAFLSRKLILLAILLHGQFIHYTQISLHPNIHFFNAQQRAYQSFLKTTWFDSVFILVACWVNFRQKLFLSKIYQACHLDVNGIKPGSNSIMTDKHTTEHSKTAALGIYWPVCDMYIAHITIWPEVSISLTEMPFLILQVNFHTSNDFCDLRFLNS